MFNVSLKLNYSHHEYNDGKVYEKDWSSYHSMIVNASTEDEAKNMTLSLINEKYCISHEFLAITPAKRNVYTFLLNVNFIGDRGTRVIPVPNVEVISYNEKMAIDKAWSKFVGGIKVNIVDDTIGKFIDIKLESATLIDINPDS